MSKFSVNTTFLYITYTMIMEINKLMLVNNIFRKVNVRTIKTYRNHYEVLKLKEDCSMKEIREAFLKLSKQYHPDKNKSLDNHSDFIRLSEAYSILSKPDSRESYDLSLTAKSFDSDLHKTASWSRQNQPGDQTFYYNRSEDKFYTSQPYYGINGLKKVSNYKIVLLCLFIAGVGVALQVFLIMRSFTLRREKLLEQSYENSQILTNIRNNALENGKEKQLQLLKAKLGYTESSSKSN